MTVVVAVAAVTYAAVRAGDDGRTGGTPGGELAPSAPSELVALSVIGARVPFVAVVGVGPGRAPSVIVLPPTLTVTVPGRGETSAAEVASLPGDSMRVAVSNAVGAWAKHYAVLDLDGLGRLVDRAGGIDVRLVEPVEIGATVVGPGVVQLDGLRTVTFLFAAGRREAVDRFLLVLTSLLGAPPALNRDDLLATDDVGELRLLWGAAKGAAVVFPPTKQVAGTVTVPDQPAFDLDLAERFGLEPPDRVIVQNGTGEPGIGEVAASRLIPAGFRVVISGNADSFDHRVTQVIAEGGDHVDEAERARRALGVGRIALSQVPSGIGDITIVVGKDFTG